MIPRPQEFQGENVIRDRTGARRWAAQNKGRNVVVCLSGRGDKDMPTLQKTLLAEEGNR